MESKKINKEKGGFLNPKAQTTERSLGKVFNDFPEVTAKIFR